jgi:hypothetical protein
MPDDERMLAAPRKWDAASGRLSVPATPIYPPAAVMRFPVFGNREQLLAN